jgi:eukaryotic-like serine/threonine-protein kinase
LNQKELRLGKYVVGDRVGAGGMGVVYRAFDTVLQRWVALKTILADKASDREFLSRFRREALAVSQIDHPNIVRLFDFVEGDPAKGDPSYMVMEFLPGQDLGKLIRQGPLEVTRAVDLILEACAALGTCHRRGFVHRDLKPTNIFVAEYDRIETAKVLDFGAAKSWAEGGKGETELSELTRKGMAVGTPEYLAPEILHGQPATPKADQYALGVVLYTALAGKKPFAVDKNVEFKEFQLWQAVAKGDHPRLRTERADVPQGLDDIVERVMQTDATRRFPDVHDFGAALLPWASAPARLRWTAHFTSAPGPGRPAFAVTSDATSPERTIPPPVTGPNRENDSTVPARPRPLSDAPPAGSGQLREVAGALSPTVGLNSSDLAARGPDSPDASISIAVDPTADVPSSNGATGVRAPVAHTTDRVVGGAGLLQRPRVLLAASAIVLAVSAAIAVTWHRSLPVASPRPSPPARLFLPRVPAAPTPSANATAAQPPSERGELSPAIPGGQQRSATGGRRPRHHRLQLPRLDKQGVPIPLN